uniref:Uncharacterized protein n=1 Tax=Ananas comosus var. bracteatus TaxID=296719 RepID=A0A6V7NU35_ANACO|nr:unnamed protein product [Ananas comosus var. bracteatus]
MQSFLRRTFSRAGGLGSCSKIGHLISSEVRLVNGNLGLHNGTAFSSIIGKETAKSFSSVPAYECYSKDLSLIQNLKCYHRNSLIMESRLLSCRDLTVPHCGMFPSSYSWNQPSFRCMTTMNNPEVSLENENSASSLL